jgi:hypothetical protein
LSGILSAQIASVARNQPVAHSADDRHQTHPQTAAAPISGYLAGPGPLEVRAVSTVSQKLRLADPVAVPAGSKQIWLPPRQQYALVEQTANEPLSVWAMHKAVTHGTNEDLIPLKGVMAHPDMVVFSPRGESIILFSQTSAKLQVVNHLPAEPTLSRTLSLPPDATSDMAISDDGALIAVARATGSVLLSSDEKWTPMPAAFSADALAFVAKTHDLLMSDTAQKVIVIFPDSAKAYRLVAQDVQADYLATTRGGEQLMAANLSQGHIWTVDLKTLQVSPKEVMANLHDPSALRDGYTFLLSNSEGLALMRLAEASR